MPRTDRLAVLAALACTALTLYQRPAEACGPDFPVHLLAQRDATLLELREGVFLIEATRLVDPPERPFVVRVGSDTDDQRTDDQSARAGGGDAERKLYERGARAFHDGELRAAERAFVQLLALPADQRRHRSTWAAYMLGRIRTGAAAIESYARVRALVADGFADDLGLAASSLGQEARVHLQMGDPRTAVELYARQAAHGHPHGATSLLLVVRDLVDRQAEGPLIGDPVGQKLLATYLFTRSTELSEAARERLWQALSESDNPAGFDRLAAFAYRQGRWDIAGYLARKSDRTALSRWVLGKLALRAGDTAEAERLLAQAGDQLDGRAESCWQGVSLQSPDTARMSGERAALALARGRALDAMTHAWQARQWHPDAMYIAERVLTIEELRVFVADLATAGSPADDSRWWTLDENMLRGILARRLMRAGRYDAAWAYFAESEKQPAGTYAAAMDMARSATDQIARAEGLFAAAQIARAHGLEILGTAHAPDWGFYGAQYDLSEWQPTELSGDFLSDVEQWRRRSSAPASNQRYHYRYIASELAERAADELPRQSQAFAAALCHSARYVFHTDRVRVRDLWNRYVREGPMVPFAPSFGQSCPEPNFASARLYLPPAPDEPRWLLWIALGLLSLALVPAVWWLACRLSAWRERNGLAGTVPLAN